MKKDDQDNTPLSRQLKIGKATVGLIGLDTGLTKVLREKMGEEEAVDFLYQTVAGKNYIPPQATEMYREALRHAYRRQMDDSPATEQGLSIKILGTGCVSCNRINTMVIDILQNLQLAAEIEQIHDLDEIWRLGVINTPALIINNEIKTSGRHPSMSEIEQWLRDVAAPTKGGDGGS